MISHLTTKRTRTHIRTDIDAHGCYYYYYYYCYYYYYYYYYYYCYYYYYYYYYYLCGKDFSPVSNVKVSATGKGSDMPVLSIIK